MYVSEYLNYEEDYSSTSLLRIWNNDEYLSYNSLNPFFVSSYILLILLIFFRIILTSRVLHGSRWLTISKMIVQKLLIYNEIYNPRKLNVDHREFRRRLSLSKATDTEWFIYIWAKIRREVEALEAYSRPKYIHFEVSFALI